MSAPSPLNPRDRAALRKAQDRITRQNLARHLPPKDTLKETK